MFLRFTFLSKHKEHLFSTVSQKYYGNRLLFRLFLFFNTKSQEKLKKYSVTIIVLTFYCSNNLFQCNFEIFQGTEAKKSESQKHYKFLAFGLEFAKLFLDSLFLTSLPWKNSKLHQNKFFSQQVRTIMVTKYHFFTFRNMFLGLTFFSIHFS